MDHKKKYYVAVETGQILEDKGATAYELEIEAKPQEVEKLQRLFSKKNVENIGLFIAPHLPTRWDLVESEVQTYNTYMVQIYEELYKLGTPETKELIEKNDIIQKLKDNFQSYDFS